MLFATLVITALGTGLGLLLGVAAKFLAVDEDPIAKEIESYLPGSQCGQCGFPGCSSAAEAVANGEVDLNFCPPGGKPLIERVAALLQIDMSQVGEIAEPMIAAINEDLCTGCTRCNKACPTDAIVGANGQIHVVLDFACTACKKCLETCPEDCISLKNIPKTIDDWHWDKPAVA